MIKTKNIITNIKDVDERFIYSHYLNLQEELDGREIWVTSIFNPSEKRPSFSIYCKGDNRYRWHDFSSGRGGDAFDLLLQLFPEKKRGVLIKEVISAYQKYLEGSPEAANYKQYGKYKVSAFELRSWNTDDARYWRQYHISSKTLDFFNISALHSFTMSKEVDGKPDHKKIIRPLLYGFFRHTGELYKIYQPENFDCRFVKVRSGYLAGFDQLAFKAENLLITKSIKDCAGFYELKIPNYEVISVDSENTMITKQQMSTLNFYKRKVVLFDSDPAGRQASEKYKEVYGIPYVDLGMEKDITDSLKATSVEKVKSKLLKLLA